MRLFAQSVNHFFAFPKSFRASNVKSLCSLFEQGDLCTPLPRLSITYFRFAEMILVSQGKVIIQFCMSGRRLMRLFSHPVNHFLATRRNLFRLRVVSRSVPLRERRTCLKAGVGVNQILLFLSVCCGTVGGAFPFIGHGRGFFGTLRKYR